jgi:hypothetical protein
LLNHFVSIILAIYKWELQWVVIEFQDLWAPNQQLNAILSFLLRYCYWYIQFDVACVILLYKHWNHSSNAFKMILVSLDLIGIISLHSLDSMFWDKYTFVGTHINSKYFLAIMNCCRDNDNLLITWVVSYYIVKAPFFVHSQIFAVQILENTEYYFF